MDVRTTFLHVILQEDIYVEQPRGFEVKDRKTHVCKLKKVLYGLNQTPKAWYAYIGSYMVKLGFTRSSVDLIRYFKLFQSMTLILVLYINELFLIGSEPLMIEHKKDFSFELEMKYLGLRYTSKDMKLHGYNNDD